MTKDLLEVASFLATNRWTWLVILSATVGALSAIIVKGPRAVLIGGLVPWFAMLSWLLYNESSMWLLSQWFGGGLAASIGAGTAKFVRRAKWTTSK